MLICKLELWLCWMLLENDLFREYLFTMPRSMEAGTKTQYCITLKGFTSSEDVQFIMRTITIINPETNLTAGQQGLASGKRGDDSGELRY